MGRSKFVYFGETLFDLTADSVTADKLLAGTTAHGADGEQIVGTCDYDSNTQDATAAVAEILEGKTAYARGAKLTGTMPNRGGVSGVISEKTGTYEIEQGYHDGSGKVQIDATEQAKLIPGNIRAGVTVLGVEGSMTGAESVILQPDKVVVPSSVQQVVLPDDGYDCLSQVTVAAIPYTETPNTTGGITVTIG